MSRVMQRNGASNSLPNDAEEECPICHSKRYLRRDMRFLVNPECYHKMCESCVDRIFSHGPAPCPVAGCNKTLRRTRFRIPTFEDLQLEREIDIRRKVAEVFNREEEDFDTLKDYNDYLNNVEDITFNLIQSIDVEATEKKLRDYEAANKQAILDNMVRAREGVESIQARQAADIQSAQLRRLAAIREEEEARREQEEERKILLQKLASGVGNAEELARESQEIMRMKAQHRKQALDNDLSALENANGSAFTINGLKKKVLQGPEKPYDPFGGMSDKRDYFTLQDDYGWDYFDKLKTDALFNAGGYDVLEYYNRALCEAFSGLGVFINDTTASAPPVVATTGAALASTSQLSPMSDDVF